MIVSVDSLKRTIRFDGGVYGCEIGRCGAVPAASKREGDGSTPIGRWKVRGVILRPDRDYAPPPHVAWRWCRPCDGWCDDPGSRTYNRPIRLPAECSAEQLWRADDRYDALVILGYNDAPPIGDLGSAIFLHLVGEGATAGCIAVSPPVMHNLLKLLGSSSLIDVHGED